MKSWRGNYSASRENFSSLWGEDNLLEMGRVSGAKSYRNTFCIDETSMRRQTSLYPGEETSRNARLTPYNKAMILQDLAEPLVLDRAGGPDEQKRLPHLFIVRRD
jgi:hypothetical protein